MITKLSANTARPRGMLGMWGGVCVFPPSVWFVLVCICLCIPVLFIYLLDLVSVSLCKCARPEYVCARASVCERDSSAASGLVCCI